ncbi:MAG: bis(5'-nucleosyl)-tetraphosphatase (symmetrical) YqeK [Spirochaetes bacterium]|nr:bis(5'-nucleosyl)-tetraphosphatase (symmetrical) YqeK [Spirochaetota bacterium]
MDITDNLIQKIDLYLKQHLLEKRYAHSLSTAITASELCTLYNVDAGKGYAAGLLHDIARDFDTDDLLKTASRDGQSLSSEEKDVPELLHARAGAVMAKELFNIDDLEIIEAIKFHTTGSRGMCDLAKIVFIADYIEPSRKHITKEYVKNLENKELNEILEIVLKSMVEYLIKKEKKVSAKTIQLLEDLENERKK